MKTIAILGATLACLCAAGMAAPTAAADVTSKYGLMTVCGEDLRVGSTYTIYLGDLRGYQSVGVVEKEANPHDTVDKLVHLVDNAMGTKVSWTPRTAGVRTIILSPTGDADGPVIDWVRVSVN
ncbi:hypothetical protein [Nocardia africana]|uniref:Uncharacterized protein n=1 Tax=Nocardia africana TaxID=134964 RepID=A0A378X1N2_9NOCA|nr:hypothetical protein [Nocardia africana]MCC3316790.1 hypothetical protein [Nocardia africana]SUA47506.1 Uncharacterised protein [Nocardia africana]